MVSRHVGRHRFSSINAVSYSTAFLGLLFLHMAWGLEAQHHGTATRRGSGFRRTALQATGGGQATEKDVMAASRGQLRAAKHDNTSSEGLSATPPKLMHNLLGRGGESTTAEGNILKCHQTVKVHSGSDKHERCPEDCPLFAQDRTDMDFCTFRCVEADACGKRSPSSQIGDMELGICRSCVVDGCSKCDTSVTEDRCAKCQSGYSLHTDGQCYFKYFGTWMYVVGAVLALIFILVLAWVVDMTVRPATNQDTLELALATRERTKFRTFDDQAIPQLYPLTTNLLQENVAGPGMTLHFNFMAALIVWPAVVALAWMLFATFVDADLWVLGTRKFGTPRHNCILVAWGYETQRRLMWAKVAFLWIVYLGTFFGSLAFAAFQLRKYRELDRDNVTIKDYAAMVRGLPHLDGSKHVEVDLKAAIENASGERVVGTSICWDFKAHASDVHEILDDELSDLIAERMKPVVTRRDWSIVRRKLHAMEKAIFCKERHAFEGPSKDDQITAMLTGLHTCHAGFVVFETEDARMRAVKKLVRGFEFEGAGCVKLESLDEEPSTVQWDNFGHSTSSELTLRIIAGLGMILLACAFWAIVFYAPYAYYVLTFNYANGREPGMIVSMSFSMIVVAGNVIMYEVCARISDWVGFKFKDSREACYLILYLIACMLNVLLDMVTTYLVVERITEGLGFRTYFGTPLFRIDEFSIKFETYGMQRALAENTYNYAWPSTFLIPFLIEPVVTITIPWFLGKVVVRNHAEIQGRMAEEWLEMAPHDLGRYADILLNVILGTLLFYFPGGYTWSMFLLMSFSHMYIYAFDQYRVLRQVPAKTYANFTAEWWCQVVTAPIVGIIASCLVFKSNCLPGCHCLKGTTLIAACTVAWFFHVGVHILALIYIVPKLVRSPPVMSTEEEKRYEDCARANPCNYFTANPIFCLRSQYIYHHSPPCPYYVLGGEGYMNANKDVGCFDEQ